MTARLPVPLRTLLLVLAIPAAGCVHLELPELRDISGSMDASNTTATTTTTHSTTIDGESCECTCQSAGERGGEG